MAQVLPSLKPQGLALLLGWRRVLFTLGVSLALGLLLSGVWKSGTPSLLLRTTTVGLGAMLAFGLFEQWPRRLPGWLARWALQVLAVAVAVPLTVLLFYLLSTRAGQPPFWKDELRLAGFAMLNFAGILVGPWAALGALVRQREAFARHQALAFELERSELERKALDARLRLLQAQVEPHFLFNTLANVRALVNAGSPQAPKVLDSLIAYLRAAVPKLQEALPSFEHELQLVRAYLELMHMRMPDRLQFSLDVDRAALALRCPPMAILTLVENAVHHGIDPSEEGGRIEVLVRLREGRCQVRVRDGGVGLRPEGEGLGTGLSNLRERLRLAFGGDAWLRLSAIEPHGVCAEFEIPAEPA